MKNRMERYPEYMTEAHRRAVHTNTRTRKPTHYADGVERPAKRSELDKLIEAWTPAK